MKDWVEARIYADQNHNKYKKTAQSKGQRCPHEKMTRLLATKNKINKLIADYSKLVTSHTHTHKDDDQTTRCGNNWHSHKEQVFR